MADVGCAGMLVADTFCGPLAAMPGPGDLVAVDRMPLSVGGCAANVAIGLARQGVAVEVAGCVGDDPAGAFVAAELAGQGVGVGRLRAVPGEPTSQTFVLLIEGEDRRYFHVVGANAAFGVGAVDRAWAASLQVLHVAGIGAMPSVDLGALADLCRWCRSEGVRTSLDVVLPSGAADLSGLAEVLPHVDLFVPNDDEAARITGAADPADQCRALRAMGAAAVAVTLGPDGVVAAEGDEVWHAPPFRVAAVDPSGGGDAFAAGVIAATLRGATFREAVVWGQAVGASATTAVGTTAGIFDEAETTAFLRERRDGGTGAA